MKYQIKKVKDLAEKEVEYILQIWGAPARSTMSLYYFYSFFKDSAFHFLFDSYEEIKAVIRLNFDFILEISGQPYAFAEAVGFVSAQEGKGYGSLLVQKFKNYVDRENLETIGFYHTELRSFCKSAISRSCMIKPYSSKKTPTLSGLILMMVF